MKTNLIPRIFFSLIPLVFVSCESNDPEFLNTEPDGGFLAFSTNNQTLLSTSIKNDLKQVKLEVETNAEITNLIPRFEVPPGITVYLNGEEQVSGLSANDFSGTVTYELKDAVNRKSAWNVTVVPVSKRIVIDASHDGGVWWYHSDIQVPSSDAVLLANKNENQMFCLLLVPMINA
jgi:hypothetical protein